jgi:hypothetical protein
MTKEEALKLYEGKHFYIIHKTDKGNVFLDGPRDDVYYTVKVGEVDVPEAQRATPNKEYKFVEVIDGIIVKAFTEEEILITDRVL